MKTPLVIAVTICDRVSYPIWLMMYTRISLMIRLIVMMTPVMEFLAQNFRLSDSIYS